MDDAKVTKERKYACLCGVEDGLIETLLTGKKF